VAFRLQDEYGVQCVFEAINVAVARWVRLVDEKAIGPNSGRRPMTI